ncbi:MAG: PnuC protein [Candidatus Electrothrix sp. YB6]
MVNNIHYYGLDWIAMLVTCIALIKIGNKNKDGFIIMMSGNTTWVVVGILADSMAMILANALFFSMNIRATIKWSKEMSSQELNTIQNIPCSCQRDP